MNISLRQLRVFQSVASTRNFSLTGQQIGLTQPAVSRCIVELEGQLGLRLLDRTTRAVDLTEAGRRLAARLDRVLDDLDACLQEVQGMATERRGRVRVASSPTLSANLMPECIALCRQALPGLQLVLLDRIQNAVLDSVRSGEVDFGVVIDPSEREDLHCEAILSEPFCLVCPPSHPLARLRQVPWTALAGQALVLLDHASGSRRLIDRALDSQGVHCEMAQEVGHPTTIFRMVEAGLGLSVVPTLALPPEGLQGLEVRALLPRVERDIVLVHRRQKALAPVAQAAWDLVREVARQRQAAR
ncbi:MAG: LysR family transcriptional regulator [Curvibacter sp.]|nr:LysR family transcriptional regulator [Curvibacter sp.]